MSKYVRKLPTQASFSQRGFSGYKFPISNQNLEVSLVDSTQGHDNFEICKTLTLIYYVLDGEGSFEIGGEKIDAVPNMLIEVPPHTEFGYTGKMKLLLIMNPPFIVGDGEITRKNPNVK